MKQDIRDLFKGEGPQMKPLPENHRQEFYQKLKASRPRRQSPLQKGYLLKVAAMAVAFVALGTIIFKAIPESHQKVAEESPIELQIEAIEQQYLVSIDEEWERFVRLTDDQKLIDRYKVKLDDLDKDYQDISKQFKSNTNNILVIEALVENLQTRLQLLRDIQDHIKSLHQNNEYYETITL